MIKMIYWVNPQKRLTEYGVKNVFETKNNNRRVVNMATLKEKSEQYEAPTTLNIADLKKVDINIDIETEEYTKDDGKRFSVDIVTIEGQKYRVPKTVQQQIKTHVAEIKDLQFVKVTKTGEGVLNTKYTVTPLK